MRGSYGLMALSGAPKSIGPGETVFPIPKRVRRGLDDVDRDPIRALSRPVNRRSFHPFSRGRAAARGNATQFDDTMSFFSAVRALRTSSFSLAGTLNLSSVATRWSTAIFQSFSVIPIPACDSFIVRPM